MTSKNSSGSNDREINLVDSLDDFLSNMDREREAINARILAAYGKGGDGSQQRPQQRNDNFGERSHDTSVNNAGAKENYGHDDNNEDDESASSSAGSLLISVRGSPGAQNGPPETSEGGEPSYSAHSKERKNITLKKIDDSKDAADNVYNITKQSQKLYDKLNISYNSHQKEEAEDATSTATTGGLRTNPTMTTYNSSPSGSSYLGTPPPLVVKKIIEERGGGQQMKSRTIQEDSSSSTIQEDGIAHDVHPAGSKESYDWILQQLSKKKEVSTGHDVTSKKKSAGDTTTSATPSALKQDAATSLTKQQPEIPSWFHNNRVSVLLRVNAAAAASSLGDDNILFPLPLENASNSIPQTDSLHCGKVVLINPKTFHNDKRLREENDTVEIARLVAQVSQISSTDDWARQFEFDDVIGMSKIDDNGDDAVDPLSSFVEQIAEETSGGGRKCSTVLFATGGTKSGKTSMVFGPFISSTITSVSTAKTEEPPSDLGMVGDIIQQVLQCNNKCAISILEIADDDVLRDIFGFSEGGINKQSGTNALRLRYGDRKRGGGPATVENLWQVPITSFEEACEIISDAFQSKSLRKIWREEGGHGHFVVTISCRGDIAHEETCIQVVDLASADCQTTATSSSRVSSIRKSLSTLRGILGQLAKTPPNMSSASALPVSFRECTLTKVLQRNLEGHDTNGLSRAVVIGCVNPSGRDYSQTLRTMNFMIGISAKADATARSPLRDGSTPASSQARITPKQSESGGVLLKSIVSDPRQRLAKLLTPQSNKKDVTGSEVKTQKIATPRSSSTYSDVMAQQRFRDTYSNVFDQLDNLMSNEDEEDNIDRDSYGNKIIQSITPTRKSTTKMKLPEPSPDTETEDFFSPLQVHAPSVGRNPKSAKKGLTGEMEMEGNLSRHDQREDGTAEQCFHSRKELAADADKVNDGPPLISEIEFERSSPGGEVWNEFSPVSSSHGRENQDIFVEKTKLVPLKTLISHDSMETELLVSCRSNANVLTSSGFDSVDRSKLSAPNEATEVITDDSDVSGMVASFQQEVEDLIKKSPSTKHRSSGDSVNESVESDLLRAKQLLSDQGRKSMALETEVKLEKARAKELSSELKVFSTILGEIDEKLDMGAPSKQGVCDPSRQTLRLERMEKMQAGLHQLFAKNQELEKLLNESHVEENKARKLVEQLEAKVDDMQSQADQSHGSSSRAVEAAEKLAEEAVRDNEALSNEIGQLRDSIARIRSEYQSLSQQHRGIVERNTELSAERERLLARNHSEATTVRKQFEACKEEKAQLEEQLASFSSKTAEMMKQRIDQMKEQYERRISMHQATIKQLGEQKDTQQLEAISSIKNELSVKQSDNERLRMRMTQMEKETSMKLQDAEAALSQVQTELNEATNEAKVHRDKNTSLQNELSQLRGIIDVAEESVNEVNRLRIENDQLQESIRSQRDQQTHDTSFEVPLEIRGKTNTNNVSFLHDADEYFMRERVTALMRENEQNNISMRTLQVSWSGKFC